MEPAFQAELYKKLLREPSGYCFSHTPSLTMQISFNIFMQVLLFGLLYGHFPQFNTKFYKQALIPQTNKAFSSWSTSCQINC